jgi:hypothetical protein
LSSEIIETMPVTPIVKAEKKFCKKDAMVAALGTPVVITYVILQFLFVTSYKLLYLGPSRLVPMPAISDADSPLV